MSYVHFSEQNCDGHACVYPLSERESEDSLQENIVYENHKSVFLFCEY